MVWYGPVGEQEVNYLIALLATRQGEWSIGSMGWVFNDHIGLRFSLQKPFHHLDPATKAGYTQWCVAAIIKTVWIDLSIQDRVVALRL